MTKQHQGGFLLPVMLMLVCGIIFLIDTPKMATGLEALALEEQKIAGKDLSQRGRWNLEDATKERASRHLWLAIGFSSGAIRFIYLLIRNSS